MPQRIPATAKSDSLHSFVVQVHAWSQVNCEEVLDVLSFLFFIPNTIDTIVLGWLAAIFSRLSSVVY